MGDIVVGEVVGNVVVGEVVLQPNSSDSTCQWEQVGSHIVGQSESDGSGYVAMSSNGIVVAVGAFGDDSNGSKLGNVRIFKYGTISGNWTQLDSDMDGSSIDDAFGSSIAMSADGTIIAIGAPTNDEGNLNAGHVRVYGWDGNLWNQVGQNIMGETRNEILGTSLALSSDGNTLAIGAPGNTRLKKGYVGVYVFDGSSWLQVGDNIDGEVQGDEFGTSVAISNNGTIAITQVKKSNRNITLPCIFILK